MIKFNEVISGEILYKRVVKKTINTPMAGIIFMMYLFSVSEVLYDVYKTGTVEWARYQWALFVIVLIPIMLGSSLKTIRQKIYKQLPKKEEITVQYEISTWYISIKDWDEQEIKWTDVYRFEETKKTIEIYLNPTQSITIDKHAMTHEDLVDLKDLAMVKLGRRKVKLLK